MNTDPDELRALASRVSRLGWQRGQLTGMTCHDSQDAAAALRACAERIEAEGWQPIETAPRDDTVPLLLYGRGVMQVGWYDAHLKRWGTLAMLATHWRPLPEPPHD